ncbi:exodeoxyribonuclease V subunit alpha [Deferrisoma camini]|uniref:exodeoxyribonuclease V subunit alpha n=1 Tax=Deferrisoma camini TaxID=1035120 RepID=UPI00046D0437|nr:exodeoxyribonuclease V subunit alpha [Deferrisoma camini]
MGDTSAILEPLETEGLIGPLDVEFARLVARLSGDARAELLLAAALTSRAVTLGHVCLPLAAPARAVGREDLPALPSPGRWAEALARSPAVGSPGQHRPLVLDRGDRLYLHRYWAYEDGLARWIRARAEAPDLPHDPRAARAVLDRLFPRRDARPDFQRLAAATALLRPLTILSGGPGTGKTHTVVRILALLLSQCEDGNLRVALAAPTGKAAARAQEAVRQARDDPSALPLPDEVRDRLPAEAVTLHRLLGVVPGRARPRYGPDRPLPHDVVVVDEVSMVDLALMAKLTAAVRPGTRLVLVGDRDQLASVEAGSVLGDLCDTGREHRLCREMAPALGPLAGFPLDGLVGDEPPPARGLVVLRDNFRFRAESGIGRVTRAVNAGRADEALELLRQGSGGEVSWKDLPARSRLPEALAPAVLEGYAPVFRAVARGEAEEAYDLLGRFRVLCALRVGPFGVEAVNRAVEAVLAREGWVPTSSGWYPGRPVLVTRNDPALRLYNGDVGLVVPDAHASGAVQVLFPTPDGGWRRIPPVRLPPHETVYAMTVHKSQGSEFDRVLLVLGDRPNPVLTRELVYTGLTRARNRAEVWGSAGVFTAAVRARAQRTSGLRDRVWEGRAD